ncbi:hypothetical protein VPH35_068603 [Triticum aestivum]
MLPTLPNRKHLAHLFHLAGQRFLSHNKLSNGYSFGLFIETIEMPKGPTCLTVDFELAARARSSGKFVLRFEDKHTGDDWMLGCGDLSEVPWSTFIANDNLFIDGVLHLRADLKVAQKGLQT